MVDIERENLGGGNLVQDTPRLSFGTTPRKRTCTKSRVRRLADPHIEPRKVNGQTYYWYRRGTDRPVYLGTAEAILRAVQATKLATAKNGT